MDKQLKRKYTLANVISVAQLGVIVGKGPIGIVENYLKTGKLTEAEIGYGKRMPRFILADWKLQNYLKRVEAIDTDKGLNPQYMKQVSEIVDFVEKPENA